jgi:hypothetical protein
MPIVSGDVGTQFGLVVLFVFPAGVPLITGHGKKVTLLGWCCC